MYFVEQKYYDNGKTEARILLESEAHQLGYKDGYSEEKESYDLYVDTRNTYEAALQLVKETLNA